MSLIARSVCRTLNQVNLSCTAHSRFFLYSQFTHSRLYKHLKMDKLRLCNELIFLHSFSLSLSIARLK